MHAKVWEALKWNAKANTSDTIVNTLWKKIGSFQTRSSLLWKHAAIFWTLFRSGALHISSGILSGAHWTPVNRQVSFHFNQVFYPSYFFFMHKELVGIIYLTTKSYITARPRITPKMSPNTPVNIEISTVFYVLWSSLEIWPFFLLIKLQFF